MIRSTCVVLALSLCSGAAVATTATAPATPIDAAALAKTPLNGNPLSFEAFKSAVQLSDGLLLDRRGKVLASKRVALNARRLDWVSLPDVSPAFVEALLLAEDQRFFSHSGVDWQSVVGSAWDNAFAGNKRGASTLSMQVAALLNTALLRRASGRTLTQKWNQMQAAMDLEQSWQKTQILEAYFNTIFFRGELQGLSAASWGLFNKAPSGLDKTEAALLASLIRAPNASPAAVAQRSCVILKATLATKQCDAGAMVFALKSATLKPKPYRNDAPHVADALIDANSLTATTTLDSTLQRSAKRILTDQLAGIHRQGAQDGALVVLDNATGDVLAYIGSSGELSQAALVDAAQAPRQAGSTLKPLLFAMAIEQQRLTAATLLDDSPVSIPTDAGLYTPHNYDEQFIGDVSVRKALASSLNIPAVRALALLKAGDFHHQLQRLGFTSLNRDAAHYGLSLALGSADVRLIELSNAYRALANGGLYSPWRWHREGSAQAKAQRVISAGAAWIVGDILSDNTARSHTFGFDSVLATPFWTAVKTGTSKDMRDNWCIGFSQHYTVGVWVGNASGAAMHNVSGVGGAAPAWAQMMRELHRHQSSRQASAPKSLVAQAIRYSNNAEPSRLDWFVSGTQPAAEKGSKLAIIRVEAKHDAALRPRITQPVDGSLMAWDPDIPAALQGIVLKHTGFVEQAHWRVNGKPLADSTLLWARDAVRGKVLISLHDAQGAPLDRVQFELRGAPLPYQQATPPSANPAAKTPDTAPAHAP